MIYHIVCIFLFPLDSLHFQFTEATSAIQVHFGNRAGWLWYLAGAAATLIWKWQRHGYESRGRGIPFWKASREWFELVTFGSKMSWAVTIGIVWVVGAVVVEKTGSAWLFGGALLDMPVAPPFCFLLGALCEMTVPALAKWLCSKIPFANVENIN